MPNYCTTFMTDNKLGLPEIVCPPYFETKGVALLLHMQCVYLGRAS